MFLPFLLSIKKGTKKMSDLFNLVKQSKLTKQQNQFWGKYEYLNKPAGEVSNEVLFRLQVSKLKILENNNIQLQNANQFLKSIQKIDPNKITEKAMEMSENQIYARIIELVNSGLISSDLNPTNRNLKKDKNGKFVGGYKDGSNKETIKSEENSIVAELANLLKLIEYADADRLTTNLYKAFQGKSKFKGKFAEFSSYTQYKANEIELLMVHALMKNEQWKSIVTGTFYNRGQQLLEDAFSFDNNVLNIEFDKGLSFTIKQGNISEDIKVKSLNDFFAQYEKLSGNYIISLSDELYDQFQKLSALASQAKSGKDLQALLNQSQKRNAISLNTLGPTSSLIGLYKLYEKKWIDENKSSKTLSVITNYCLSKSIALTNITGNQIYFTRDGFITASKWMELYRQMLKFNPEISKISKNLLDKAHPYIFTSVI